MRDAAKNLARRGLTDREIAAKLRLDLNSARKLLGQAQARGEN
jgi:orotate phosphoribosyltransferase-like protein